MNSNEIAALAHVSRSTVSRVVNHYPNVPEETRRKVQEIIDRYGYTPSTSARTLAGKSNDIIGVFLADIDHTDGGGRWVGMNSPYNAKLLAEIIKSCKKRGYMVLVNTITEDEDCENLEQHFKNRLLFGGIFVGFPYHMKSLEELALKEYNVTFVDQWSEEEKIFQSTKNVNCNDRDGAKQAVRYLIQHGHREIAFLQGDNRLSAIARLQGYQDAMHAAGIPIREPLMLRGEYREDVAYRSVKKMLETERPTALFASNDIMALGASKAIREAGLQIPEDISLVGYDNLQYMEWLDLHLTTMQVSMEELAENAVDLLFTEKSYYCCEAQLVQRSSVVQAK